MNKSTGSCSKGSNQQQIVEQINKYEKSEANITIWEIYYSNCTKGTACLLLGMFEIPEEERPCISKLYISLTVKLALFFFYIISSYFACLLVPTR